MKYNIDDIIMLMRKISDSDKIEMGEQDAESAPAPDDGKKPDYPTITKWESGVTRGPANQIGNTKWSDIVKPTRGKANTLL